MWHITGQVRFVCDVKEKNKMTLKGDGIVDSVRYLTIDVTKENKVLLNMILPPDM